MCRCVVYTQLIPLVELRARWIEAEGDGSAEVMETRSSLPFKELVSKNRWLKASQELIPANICSHIDRVAPRCTHNGLPRLDELSG